MIWSTEVHTYGAQTTTHVDSSNTLSNSEVEAHRPNFLHLQMIGKGCRGTLEQHNAPFPTGMPREKRGAAFVDTGRCLPKSLPDYQRQSVLPGTAAKAARQT